MATYQSFPYGKFNQSYKMMDENNESVFEANLKKFHLFLACQYEFVNQKNGQTAMKKIGKTVNSTSGGDSFSVTTDSRFKIDGVNCFDLLDEKGLHFKSAFGADLFHPAFDLVDKQGNVFANYKTNVLADKQKGVGAVGSKQRNTVITTESDDIELIFLGAFILQRVDYSIFLI